MAVVADVDLHPLDVIGEAVARRAVVRGGQRAGIGTHVAGLIGGECYRLGLLDPPRTDSFAVVVQPDVTALGQATAVVGEEDLGNSWRKSFEADVRQSEFAVKPYSLLMGSMKVVDAVMVSVTVDRAKDD